MKSTRPSLAANPTPYFRRDDEEHSAEVIAKEKRAAKLADMEAVWARVARQEPLFEKGNSDE